MKSRRSIETFRLHLMLTTALVVICFACIAAVLTFVPLLAHFDSAELGSNSSAELAAYLIHLHESFWPMIGGAVVASVASAMLVFERMRAPLVGFVSVYRLVAGGKTPGPVRIRRLDYLQDEADELNRMLDALQQRRAAEQRQLARVDETLCELDACELQPKSAAAIAEIRDALALLRQNITESE